MPKPARWWVGLAPLIVALTVLLIVFLVNRTDGNNYVLRLGGHSYRLEAAATPAAQEKGLSGRAHLAADRGMIFVFPGQDARCFWMQGMRFPLDIIWADNTKRVAHIERDLSPATYPKQYCAEAKYVIELPAGTAAKNHLSSGQRLGF